MNPDMEVFRPATPLGFEGGRTAAFIRPAQMRMGPSSSWKYWTGAALMDDVYRVMQRTCVLLRSEMATTPTEGASKVRECFPEDRANASIVSSSGVALDPRTAAT